MEFEADRMTGLVLTDANVLPERDVVLEEFNMRVANSPEARIGEQVAAALYLNHPYGRPVIGWHSEIEKLNREDALAFYRRFYTPNNAVVVIAGDVTGDEVKPMAETDLWQGRARDRSRSAHPAAGAGAGRGAPAHHGGPPRRPAVAPAQLPGALRAIPPSPANRRRWTCSPMCSGSARPAASIARW